MYMRNTFHNEITQLYNKFITHDIWKIVNMGHNNYKWNQFETQLNFGAFYFLDEILFFYFPTHRVCSLVG